MKGWTGQVAALACLGLFAACEAPLTPVTAPESAPLPPARTEAPAPESERSDYSRALAVYYQRLQNDLLNIWERDRKTVLFVTHSVDEAVFLSDKVVVMTRSPGRIKEIVDI